MHCHLHSYTGSRVCGRTGARRDGFLLPRWARFMVVEFTRLVVDSAPGCGFVHWLGWCLAAFMSLLSLYHG